MEIHQVQYFLAVCETLDVARAAARCRVAQPSFTRAIRNLEDELGGPLFNRQRLSTSLTELGRVVRPHLAELFARAEAARSRAFEFGKGQRVSFTAGVACAVGPRKLLGLIGRLRQRCPDVDVCLRDGNGHTLQRMLLAGEIEVALYGPLGEICAGKFQTVKLYNERLMIMAPRGHRFERQKTVRLEDISGEHYLSRDKCELGESLRSLCQSRGIAYIASHRSERDDLIQAMVRAGLGISAVPEFALTAPEVVARPLVAPEIARAIHLVTVRGRPCSLALRAFMAEAAEFDWTT